MRRREFIVFVGGAAVAWPLVARAQRPTMPVIGYLSTRALDDSAHLLAAFRPGHPTVARQCPLWGKKLKSPCSPALAVPTSSLGPMSKIAQFSN
jgi:hypothetical protein